MFKNLSNANKLGLGIAGSIALIAIGYSLNEKPSITNAPAQTALAPELLNQPARRFSSKAIEAAKLAIASEADVVDLTFDESNAIEWNVAMIDDGTRRYGYAQSICIILRQAGAYDDRVDVRIVDASKRAQFKDAYSDYSLGAVRCKDEQALD
jgi:hypothetical protein